MYAVLGATGNTGSLVASTLLQRGHKVRVLGRDPSRLDRFARRGAEAFVAHADNAAALTQAFSGCRAAYLLLPPSLSSPDYRADQERESDAIAKAVADSGLPFAVLLSSYGAQVPSGTGPIAGVHSAESKLRQIGELNCLFLRAGYFMENNLAAIRMIQGMGVFGNALRPDVKLPMIATRDIGEYAAKRLLNLDFSGKPAQELLGQRDISPSEATSIIARGIGRPDLRYVQFPYDQVAQLLIQMGIPPKTAGMFVEMNRAINEGVVTGTEQRSPENTTPTTFERFVQDVFVPAYHGKAATA